MRNILLSMAALATFASPALAHPEHDEMPREVVRKPMAEMAKGEVIRLVTQAKLSASWSKATAINTKSKVIGGVTRWVVTFQNPAIRIATQRALYIVLTQNGEFVSHSFTPPK